MEVGAEVILSAQSGDKAALEELISNSYRPAYTLAVRLMGNPHDAQEATQEAYIRVIKGLGRLEEPGAFATWLFRIVSNVCVSQLRKRSRTEIPMQITPEQDPDPVDAEELAIGRLQNAELESCVGALPDAYRTIVVLRDIYDMSVEQTGDVLGISEAAVKVRLHRARKKLREEVLNRYPDIRKETA